MAGRKPLVDKSKAIALRDAGLTYQEIADIQGVTPGAIYKNIKDLPEIKSFRENKDHVYERLQHDILKSISEEDIKKSPMGSRVLAIAQIEDKIRAIRGQSHINIMQIVAHIEAIQRADVD